MYLAPRNIYDETKTGCDICYIVRIQKKKIFWSYQNPQSSSWNFFFTEFVSLKESAVISYLTKYFLRLFINNW